jgi:hypothetical protein
LAESDLKKEIGRKLKEVVDAGSMLAEMRRRGML